MARNKRAGVNLGKEWRAGQGAGQGAERDAPRKTGRVNEKARTQAGVRAGVHRGTAQCHEARPRSFMTV